MTAPFTAFFAGHFALARGTGEHVYVPLGCQFVIALDGSRWISVSGRVN